jgi:mono/diheme cytochrome c family protein
MSRHAIYSLLPVLVEPGYLMKRRTLQLIQAALVAALLLPAAFAQTSKTVWDGVYTEVQAERGRNIYLASCARCHGDDLAGFGGSLDGKRFMEGWGEDTVHSLFNRIQTTMPPGQAGSLEDQAYVDIVSFILSRNDFPVGDVDLGTEGLKDIRIQEKDGPAPVPSFAMVQVVGCLVMAEDDAFGLSHAGAAVRVRDPKESEGEELAAAVAQPLGDKSFALLRNVIYLEPQGSVGHKVEVKGFLIRNDAGDRINVSTLQSLGESCAE